MSLLPLLFSDWWEDLDRPHRIMDQHFGLPLSSEDLSSDNDLYLIRPRRRALQRYQPYDRAVARRSTGASTVKADKDKFEVSLDVQQFLPEEVSVKVNGKNVIIEGKHEEKQDEHGWISRQFVRKYYVPEQCDIDQLKSSLSSDGVLTITAPRKELEAVENKEKIIKIQHTGQPAIKSSSSIQESSKDTQQAQKSQTPQRGQDKTVKAA